MPSRRTFVLAVALCNLILIAAVLLALLLGATLPAGLIAATERTVYVVEFIATLIVAAALMASARADRQQKQESHSK